MSIVKYKSLAINISLSLFSVIVTLIVLEIFIRIFFPASHQNQQIMAYHPQAGYQLQKNLDIKVDTGNQPVHLITNEYGYVGESYPLEKPKDEFRIVHFGDSYTYGVQMVDWNKTFVALTEEILNSSIKGPLRARSINFGISGRGTIEEFWAYKYVAQEADPDLVIVWVTIDNDLLNNYLPVTDYASLGNNKMGIIKYTLKKSALVSYVFERMKYNIRFVSILNYLGLSNKVVYDDDSDLKKDGVPFEGKINYLTTLEMTEMQEHAYKVTEELFQNFKELTFQNDEQFLVVLIPERGRMYPDLQDEFFEIYPKALRENYDFSKAVNYFVDMLEKNDIDFLDLTDFIKLYDDKKSDIEYCGNVFGDHFSPCGHQVTAEIISQYIIEHYINQAIHPEEIPLQVSSTSIQIISQ